MCHLLEVCFGDVGVPYHLKEFLAWGETANILYYVRGKRLGNKELEALLVFVLEYLGLEDCLVGLDNPFVKSQELYRLVLNAVVPYELHIDGTHFL